MNKKAKFLTRMLTLILSLVVVLSTFEPAYAQRRKKVEPPKSVIPKEKRPKLFLAWIAGSTLAAATIALGIKNSRRTHLD
jgi:hypothetical protein